MVTASAGVSAAPPQSTCLTCHYCGSSEHKLWCTDVRDYLGYVAGAWEFWRCVHCGSLALVPRPDETALAGFYPPVYSFNTDAGGQNMLKRILAWLEYNIFFAPQYRSQARKILRVTRAAETPGKSMLDVGCGRGLRLIAFRNRGLRVHGMDLQPAVVEYVKTKLNIPAVCTGIAGLGDAFHGQTFDVVSAFWVIEHVPNARALVEQCWRLLKSGGWLVCAIPRADSLQRAYLGKRWVNVAEAPRHVSLPSLEGMMRLCKDVGFRECSCVSDSTLACAGMIGISLFPGAATSHVYGKAPPLGLLKRALAAAIALLAVPWCLVENYVVRRSASEIVFARKP